MNFLFLLIMFSALSFGTGSDWSRNLDFKNFMELFSKCKLFHFLLLCCRQALFVTLYVLYCFLDSHSLNTYLKVFMNSPWKMLSFHANICGRKENSLCNLPESVFCLLPWNISWGLWGFTGFFCANMYQKTTRTWCGD